jgi:hypothetical protein
MRTHSHDRAAAGARARDCSGNPFGVAKRLERKARFAAFYAANAPKFRIINGFLNRLFDFFDFVVKKFRGPDLAPPPPSINPFP